MQTVKELHEKRMDMWNRSIENHTKYINKTTNLFDKKYVKTRVCPVCDSTNEMEIFTKEGGRYVKCLNCNMIYLNPVFTDEALTQYYKQNHTQQSEVVESDTDNFYTTIYNNGLDDILKHTKNSSTILDIGCSSGSFLSLSKNRGLKTFGIELNKSEVEFAKAKGHSIYNNLLEDINFKTKFDIVTLWDVFEHLKDGKSYLNQIKNILCDDGVIFLQIPNSDALAAKILREKCNMFDGLEHVNLYGIETIKKLASKCDFKILSIKTVISEIGVMNNYLNYENPYLGSTTNKKFIPNLIDEEKIHQTLQGYKIQIILRKQS
jgi:2-polyprenyl-3-methyl-5-hydroxy-6-metoxy-1,4-benzoquinol methylase